MNTQKRMTQADMWRIIYPLVTYNAITFFLTFLASMLAMAATARGSAEITDIEDYTAFLQDGLQLITAHVYEIQMAAAVITIPLLLLYRRMDRERLAGTEPVPTYEPVSPFLYVFVIVAGLAASLIGNNILFLSGLMQSSEAYVETTEALIKGNFILELIGLGILIPICEELIFRGLMYSRIREFLPVTYAAVLCSVCFAFSHGNIVQGLFAFFLGLLMIYLLERYHSLWAPILFHATSNILAVVQGEKGLLDAMYQENGTVLLIIVSVVSLAVLAGVLLLIEKVVHSEEVK